MAEELESYEFTRGAVTKYPWEDWTNGRPWRIRRGEDYTSTNKAMMQHLYTYARRHGQKVTVRKEDEETIVFQFIADELAKVVEKVKSRKKGG